MLARDGAKALLVLDHDDVEAPVGMRGMRVWTLALDRLEGAL